MHVIVYPSTTSNIHVVSKALKNQESVVFPRDFHTIPPHPYRGFVAMSVPIEIENLYGSMDMDGEYLVVRISFKKKKIGESF